MISETLSKLGISNVVAAIAAGTIALGGAAGAAVVADSDDRPETPEVPVEVDAQVDGPATALEANDARSAQDDEQDVDDEEQDAAELDGEGDGERPEDTHGFTVSEAATNGTTGQDLADIASDGRSELGAENGAEASGGRSTAGADNGQAPEDVDVPEDAPADTPTPDQAQQGKDRAAQQGDDAGTS